MLLIQIIWKIFLAHRERKAEKHMEKNKTVWMFLTALVISLVIVGGSMTLSVRPVSYTHLTLPTICSV